MKTQVRALMISQDEQQLGMEHPIHYLRPVLEFLEHLIRDQGDYLFIGLVYACMIFLAWYLVQPKPHPAKEYRIVILPRWGNSRQESSHDSDLF
jgi:hypothetical protein